MISTANQKMLEIKLREEASIDFFQLLFSCWLICLPANSYFLAKLRV
jgi:hypothetical protein